MSKQLRPHLPIARRVSFVVAACLVATACGSSDGDAGGREFDVAEYVPARQEIVAVDPPAEAAVETTTTTTTSTTTTTVVKSQTTTTTIPDGPGPSSGDEVAFESGGTEAVGTDVQPGIYIAQPGDDFCTWERTLADGTVEDNIYRGQIVLEILSSDTQFKSDVNCGTWEPYSAPAEPATTIDEGHWVVGEQIVPGTYRTDESTFDFCYWERSNGLTAVTDEIIVNAIVMEATEVTIEAGDAKFISSGCGTWTLID